MKSVAKTKQLRLISFIVHATRGLLRDRWVRRRTMVISLFAAVLSMIAGSTLLPTILNPRVHPVWFIFFWLACAWVTVLTMLLALLDILVTTREARAVRQALLEATHKATGPDNSSSR